MKREGPRVSVGLPVFNGENYLARALDSLLEQEYKDFEIVISDNASTDRTAEICREYSRRDERIRYFRNDTNIGLAPNHNRVFELARGEFFKWAAHDDEYPPGMLRRLVEVMEGAPPSVAVVYSVCEYVSADGESLGLYTDGIAIDDTRAYRRLAHLLLHIDIYNCTYGLIRSSLLRRTRLHGSFPIADRVLFSELAMLGEFIEMQEPLLKLRIHAGRSFTRHTDPQALRELFDPGSKGKRAYLSIEGRVQIELLRSAWRVPSRVSDKATCLLIALVAPSWRQFKGFGGRQKRKLRAFFSPSSRNGLRTVGFETRAGESSRLTER